MKKCSLFFIVIICVLSVVVISFFGLKVEMGQFTVYMTSITITNESQTMNNGTKYISVKFDEEAGYASVYLDYTYEPSDATYPSSVSYSLSGSTTYVGEDGETHESATISQSGEVVFYRPAAVTATITTTDGSQLTDSIYIFC